MESSPQWRKSSVSTRSKPWLKMTARVRFLRQKWKATHGDATGSFIGLGLAQSHKIPMIQDLLFESGLVTVGRKKTGAARWVPGVSERGAGPSYQPKKERGGDGVRLGCLGRKLGRARGEGRAHWAEARGRSQGLSRAEAGPWPLATRPRVGSLLPLFFISFPKHFPNDTTRGGWLFDVFSMTIVHNVIYLSVL